MAKSNMRYTLVKNNLPQAKEPYTGHFVSNGTIEIDAFTDTIAKGRTNIDAATIKMILRTGFTIIGETIASDLTRIDTGTLAFEPAISGSVATMDGALGEENEVYIAVRSKDSLKKTIGAIVPNQDANDSVDGIRIDYIFDIASDARGQISGTNQFRVLGRKITVARPDLGEELYVIDAAGEKIAASVDNGEEAGQRINATLSKKPATGKGTLVLVTKGYPNHDGELVTLKKAVTIV